MIDQNGIIQKPISIKDIQTVLQTNESDLGKLCTHPNINVKSLYKPTYINSSYDNYGYNIKSIYGIDNLKQLLNNIDSSSKIGLWETSTLTKYSLGSFEKYNHNQTQDLFNLTYTINGTQINPIQNTLNINIGDQLKIELKNGLINPSKFYTLSSKYFCIVLIGENEDYIITQNTTINNSNNKYEINISSLPSGQYVLYPCVSKNSSNGELEEYSQKYYNLYALIWNPFTLNIAETVPEEPSVLQDLIISNQGIWRENSSGDFPGGDVKLVTFNGGKPSDIEITSGSNNVLIIDDWAIGIKQLVGNWVGGTGAESTIFNIKLSSPKYNRTWNYTGQKPVEESGAPLLYAEYLGKLVRIPYTGEEFQFVDYIRFYPLTFASDCLYDDSQGFKIQEFNQNTNVFEYREITNNDIVQYDEERLSALDFKYTFTVAPNNTNEYKHITLVSKDDDRLHIDIVIEPQARNRIYYGNSNFSGRFGLESQELFQFSVINSKVLSEEYFVTSGLNNNYGPIVCYPSSNFDYNVTVVNNSGNPTNYYRERKVMWGNQEYTVISNSTINKFNVVFTKK